VHAVPIREEPSKRENLSLILDMLYDPDDNEFVVASRSRNRRRGRHQGTERPPAYAECRSGRRTGLLLLMDWARPPGLAEPALLRLHDRQRL